MAQVGELSGIPAAAATAQGGLIGVPSMDIANWGKLGMTPIRSDLSFFYM